MIPRLLGVSNIVYLNCLHREKAFAGVAYQTHATSYHLFFAAGVSSNQCLCWLGQELLGFCNQKTLDRATCIP